MGGIAHQNRVCCVEFVGWSDFIWPALSSQKHSQFLTQSQQYGVTPSRWIDGKVLRFYARKFPLGIPTESQIILT
jgi:hypothetical protein